MTGTTTALPARDALRDAGWFASAIGKSEDWVITAARRREIPHHKIGQSFRFDDHCLDLFRHQTLVLAKDPMARTALSQQRKKK